MPTPREGALRIAAERQRQIEELGYTREHDLAHHTTRELMDAAWCYFFHAYSLIGGNQGYSDELPALWPFDPSGWKPAATSVRNLEKVGALIGAVIDRQIAEGLCPDREDATHCVHWWDDDGPCCSCGDDTPTSREEGGGPLTDDDRMALPDEPEGASLGNILGYKIADPDPDDLAEPFGLPEDDY